MTPRAALAAAAVAAALTGAAHAAELTVTVRSPQGTPVQDAVVWVEGVAGPGKAAPKSAEIRQIDQEFDPFVTVVGTGARVLFPNVDRIKHHVYSFSPAKSFEIQLYSGTPAAPIVFDKPGVVVVGCNIHDWMLAYVVVLDSPWFAKSGASGRAPLAQLPAGSYVLHVWHPYQSAEVPVQTVQLDSARASREVAVQLTIAAPPRKPRRALDGTY